jgi:hypothetical protein
MSKSFDASEEFGVETIQSVPVPGRASALTPLRGRVKAHVTIWDPTEHAHPSLPTLAEFLEQNLDANGRVVTYQWDGHKLTIDARPLLAFTGAELEYRVSPGAIFVSDEARNHDSSRSTRGA